MRYDRHLSQHPDATDVFRVGGSLFPGELKITPSANPLSEMVSLQHNADLAGRFDEYEYEWKIAPPVDGQPPAETHPDRTAYQALTRGVGVNRYTLGASGINGLVDNWIVMRYRPKTDGSHPLKGVWSEWTKAQSVEGWIKRVLEAINPFGQRVTDLYNNSVNTDVSVLTSAGKRWEGDIALNMDTINNYGLIEIYETVLRRGRGLSIDAGINFGPANDALLLAAGYLNDLYMLVGNEAYADAANPTIGIGTKDRTYGDIATALFAFKGQTASLLEEELGLLRGRDDFLEPGVDTSPAYNRLYWNYTRGIDAGEVIYALNYNILDQNNDGKVNAADALKLYPQGHGDAYGHYLTAVKGYYSLLMNNKFDWVPRIETVTILGKAVSVDYLDERKFAAAAAAVARTGRQVFDLTWRKDYQAGQSAGWQAFNTTRTNTSRTLKNGPDESKPVREWGLDQWASRTQQGSYLNWIVGNAILPAEDPDKSHEGIQKIDRTTVPELGELVATGAALQTAMDHAEGRLTPLGLTPGSLVFDLNPNTVVGAEPQTHFDQVYNRAKVALNNAVLSFDDAKDVTRLMRSEEDSLADFKAGVGKQELAYTNALIEIYGTPYADDIGVGKTYKQDYKGPDLKNFMLVNDVELRVDRFYDPTNSPVFRIDKLNLSPSEILGENRIFDFPQPPEGITLLADLQAFVKREAVNLASLFSPAEGGTNEFSLERRYVEYRLNARGYIEKPATWTGRRSSPGQIQAAIGEVILAHNALNLALEDYARQNGRFDRQLALFDDWVNLNRNLQTEQAAGISQANAFAAVKVAFQAFKDAKELAKEAATDIADTIHEAFPRSLIAGVAAGGDLTSGPRAAIKGGLEVAKAVLDAALSFRQVAQDLQEAEMEARGRWGPFKQESDKLDSEARNRMAELDEAFNDNRLLIFTVNARLRQLAQAHEKLHGLTAQGDRLQAEREVTRQRTAAVIQGFRTRDAAFRIFRNEKLERYKSLFDLAARYAYLAATAYDYETGLLGTERGRSFVNRIINARALGVVKDGEPQYAGSNTGDPGLSSALAEMKADWDVLKGRLGFNNPDAYGTTASLRAGRHRILAGSDGDAEWQNVLEQGRRANLLEDADVKRACLQIDPGDGLPVPGIVLTFSTTIADGMNLFGLPSAAGDVKFNPSAFATKIFGLGVALEGYRGMQDPVANGSAVNGAGGTSPADPPLSFLDTKALDGSPFIYLIPVGVDSMRSPPLGDTSTIRTWDVADVAIPLPFNIGGSDFSTKQLWNSSDSLTEALFAVRKHQAFRPVATTTAFSSSLYTGSGSLQRSQFTNNRLIGRSAWNSQWKVVIPGRTLLNDPKEGLDRFIQSVKDVKLHFITYSYSGN